MFQTACCLCNNEVEPVWVGTNSYASLILVELAPGCCLQKHVCRLNLSWWMFKRYEHVHIYIYTWPYVIYIYIILYYIYVSIYALMAVGVYVCIMYAPTYVPPTDCRTATGAMVKSRRHDAFQNRWKKTCRGSREVHHLLMNGEQTGDFLLISATKTGDIGDIYI